MDEQYLILFIIIGLCSLVMSYLPSISDKFKISYTVILLVLGFLVYFIYPFEWPKMLQLKKELTRFSEFVVILSLMNAGLKIGLKYPVGEWLKPIRLVLFMMPSLIIIYLVIFHYVLSLPLLESLLLAAVLSPTDPVLASELQLNDKQLDHKKNTGIKYTLTSEAGLNDGLAFPFVYLAILLSKNALYDSSFWLNWIGFYIVYKIVIGILLGIIIGYLYSLSIKICSDKVVRKVHNGFVAISLLLISYGATELLNGYGFLSVFFTGLFSHYHLHKSEKDNVDNSLLQFPEDLEKFLIVGWLIYFGGVVVGGGFLGLTIFEILICLGLIVVIRPILGYLSLIKTKLTSKKKLAISYFGMKGIGSVFYLFYALDKGNFVLENKMISIIVFVLFSSIAIHGTLAKRMISYFKKVNPG